MKIKFLLLPLVVAGIIMISGCVDTGKQPLTAKAPVNLYKNIFYPYAGLLDHRNYQMPEVPHPDLFPSGSRSEPMNSLRDATSLLDRNIERAEIVSKKLEEGIQRQKAEGKDVSRLEALLDKYKLLVNEAKNYRALADKAFTEENNRSVTDSNLENNSTEYLEREYLIKSQMCMIQANYVLREIFKELQHQMPGSVVLNDTSHLSASGAGMVNLMGNFTLNLHMEKGEMAIPAISQNSEVYIKGDYTFEEKTDTQGDVDLYHISSADVKISGSHKMVLLRGQNISLTTDGEGYAAFLGNGTYSIEEAGGIKKEENWAHPFFREGTNPDEYGPDGRVNNITTVSNHM